MSEDVSEKLVDFVEKMSKDDMIYLIQKAKNDSERSLNLNEKDLIGRIAVFLEAVLREKYNYFG